MCEKAVFLEFIGLTWYKEGIYSIKRLYKDLNFGGRRRKMSIKNTLISIVLLCICLIMTGCSDKEQDNKKLEEAFQGYIQCIKDYVDTAEYDVKERIRYTLIYINDDDVPELAISEGESHAAGVRVFFYDFESKNVVDTGERYGENGGFYYYDRKNMIYDYYFGNGGYANVCFCKIGSDYKLTRSRWFVYYGGGNGDPRYWIDFEEVSPEEYDKAYREDVPEFVDDDIIRVDRENMKGNYQTCCSENAIRVFYEILERSGN